jgi:hypothetical protein
MTSKTAEAFGISIDGFRSAPTVHEIRAAEMENLFMELAQVDSAPLIFVRRPDVQVWEVAGWRQWKTREPDPPVYFG